MLRAMYTLGRLKLHGEEHQETLREANNCGAPLVTFSSNSKKPSHCCAK